MSQVRGNLLHLYDLKNKFVHSILLSKLTTVTFGSVVDAAPVVPKHMLYHLPDTELRQWMIDKELPHVNLPAEADFDCHAAIAVMRPDYIHSWVRKSVVGMDDKGYAVLEENENGNVIVATEADGEVATQEWWRALTNPKVYHDTVYQRVNRPYSGKPAAVPGSIHLEEYDFGGEGVGYHSQNHKSGSDYLNSVFRMTDRVLFRKTEEGRDLIASMRCNDWLLYTIDVKQSGNYNIALEAAGEKAGSFIHLLFAKNQSRTTMKIQSSEEMLTTCSQVFLEKGVQTVQAICAGGYVNLRDMKLTLA